MVKRLSELPEVEARHLSPDRVVCPTYDDTPLLPGKPLAERRVAIISTAGLHKRGDRPFRPGDGSYRVIPAETRASELVADGTVGSMASVHYSFMGAFPPAAAEPHAQHLAGLLKADKVDAALLVPV